MWDPESDLAIRSFPCDAAALCCTVADDRTVVAGNAGGACPARGRNRVDYIHRLLAKAVPVPPNVPGVAPVSPDHGNCQRRALPPIHAPSRHLRFIIADTFKDTETCARIHTSPLLITSESQSTLNSPGGMVRIAPHAVVEKSLVSIFTSFLKLASASVAPSQRSTH